MTRGAIALAIVSLGCAAVAPAQDGPAARLADARAVRKRLGIAPEYERVTGLGTLKVAILDYGFDGIGRGRGYLPDDAVIVEHYDPEFVRRNGLGDPSYRKGFEPGNHHGRLMAMIVWAVAGARPDGPKFFLLNANGPTMLRRAVRFAIERQVDLILFSESFEGGGNGDGRGPINRVVDEATAAGIIWINAAGNYGNHVYNGPVRVLPDGYLRLRDGSDIAALRFRNHLDENRVTITLTWNDYRQAEDAGTAKDLDLFVEDWSGRLVGTGEKVQVAGAKTPGPNESRNPRERVVLDDLPANPEVRSDPDYCYRIRIRARRGRFDRNDRLRVLVTASHDVYLPPSRTEAAEALVFVDATGHGELYPPADNPRVLTVGDASTASSIGPTADGRLKPDLLIEDSRTYLTDGEVSAGSSNAAAYFAGVVAVLKAAEPTLTAAHLFQLARAGPALSRTGRSARDARAMAGLRTWKTPSRARLAEVVRSIPTRP